MKNVKIGTEVDARKVRGTRWEGLIVDVTQYLYLLLWSLSFSFHAVIMIVKRFFSLPLKSGVMVAKM